MSHPLALARTTAACALAACLVAAPVLPAEAVTEQEVRQAREQRQRLQQELDDTVAGYDAAQSRLARTQSSMDQHRQELQELEEVSQRVQRRVTDRANEVYRRGPVTMFQFLIGADSFNDFGRRLTLLQAASEQDASVLHEAEITRNRINRLQADLASQEAQEQQILAEMSNQAEFLNTNFSKARELETELAADKAEADRRAEQRAQQAAAQQAAEEEAAQRRLAQAEQEQQADESPEPEPEPSPSPALSPSPSPSPAPDQPEQAPSASGLYCPVDGPVSFTDTYGHPRSGGRSHKGVDMFAARGTPVAAITDGTITRRSSSTLGGLYIYFKGTNGTEYFYTHLQGFTDVPAGTQVKGGTHIGYVGNTGNARGTPPHVHFEVAPAGSGSINPTPTARRACGK
ncbi:MAG: peptidoglycan DD-metalloendopeptidase family protein [Actinomycetota bacterium]